MVVMKGKEGGEGDREGETDRQRNRGKWIVREGEI